jgi:hypothetical protein
MHMDLVIEMEAKQRNQMTELLDRPWLPVHLCLFAEIRKLIINESPWKSSD